MRTRREQIGYWATVPPPTVGDVSPHRYQDSSIKGKQFPSKKQGNKAQFRFVVPACSDSAVVILGFLETLVAFR
ncbi:hypothetical protein PtA15_2A123 [Puccinia triticina]|uniref:Uncharacterized protein n=1 Tax=Puccinia triticina TaxID=208348 RepID=A0ABY7C9F4_9BASI|nr:uncharacterized protein PtA15_2A123 [Puccinia triticina]WAQ81811.1 hypothetical protein PtA15_2A123 [Puccinia triticina]